MLFNSHVFLLAFLPLTLLGFYTAGRRYGLRAALLVLIAASLVFYGWWNPVYLPLLLGAAAANYLVGERIAAAPARSALAKRWLALGVLLALANLGYFKYATFVLDNAAGMAGLDRHMHAIVLPLAISFYTFQNIGYLADVYQAKTRSRGPIDYLVFLAFFPQLIAGPIVHHRTVSPQYLDPRILTPTAERFAVGLTIFAVGLFKKVVIADGMAIYATPVFADAEAGVSPTLIVAWMGALAYTFQLYFDFSGYSDMAIGLGRLFGIKLPVNFFSPYKATSIIDFWRRWHITLSNFLRDYLYVPLGGNRLGERRRFFNLFVTMLIGGVWHGAGWTFVLWGALHGLYLVINHLWRLLRPNTGDSYAGQIVGWLLTFTAIVVGWVIFRAESLDSAWRILAGMAGLNGIELPAQYAGVLAPLAPLFEGLGIGFGDTGFFGVRFVAAILALFFIVLALPNLYELFADHDPAHGLDTLPRSRWGLRATWRPGVAWAVAFGVVAAVGILGTGQASEFLYFQF